MSIFWSLDGFRRIFQNTVKKKKKIPDQSSVNSNHHYAPNAEKPYRIYDVNLNILSHFAMNNLHCQWNASSYKKKFILIKFTTEIRVTDCLSMSCLMCQEEDEATWNKLNSMRKSSIQIRMASEDFFVMTLE